MKDWLLSQRNLTDGAWGAANGCPSDIYSTFLAVQALQFFDIPNDIKHQVRFWILGNFGQRGWDFGTPESPSPSATSYALIALHILGVREDPKIDMSVSFLLQMERWNDEEVNYAGTLWKHCTHSNVISALALYEDDIFSPTIANAIRYSNKLISPHGGWMETADSKENRTVRAQY